MLGKLFWGFLRFTTSLGLLAIVMLVLGRFLAKHFWWAELATHFVLHIWAVSAILFVLFIIQSRWKSVGIAFVILAWHSYMIIPLFLTEEYGLLPKDINAQSPKATRILQYNLHFTDTDVNERMQWVLKQAPDMDVIVLLEVSNTHAQLLDALAEQFPYRFAHLMREYRGVAIFSRLPSSQFVVRDTVDQNTHYVVMTAIDKAGSTPLALYAVHPPPPISEEMAYLRNEYFTRVKTDIISNPAQYKILVGDFNMTRWSPYFQSLMTDTNMVDSFEGFGHKTTWPSWLPEPLRLTIDNLLIYENPNVTGHMVTLDKVVGPANGSDHYPVITTLY